MDTTAEEPNLLDLANVRYCRSTLTGAAILCPEQCTTSDSRPCHIFEDLDVWNEYLCLIQFELKEEVPGQLHLVSLDPQNLETSHPEEIHRAFTLLYLLLKNHRCVVAFHMGSWNTYSRHRELISRGMQGSSVLKSINVGRNKWLMDDLAPFLASLTVLEELSCYALDRPRGFFRPLCSFLAISTSIKSLDVMNVTVDAFEAKLFWDALENNVTLEKISFNSSCLLPGRRDYTNSFSRYIQGNTRLTSLFVSCPAHCRRGELKSVIDAASHSESLRSICLSFFFIDDQAVPAIQNFLTHNSTLRRFLMVNCEWQKEDITIFGPRYESQDPGEISERIRPWLSILQTNRSLEEIQLSLTEFNAVECAAFLHELSKSPTIRKATIEDLGSFLSSRIRYIHGQPNPAETGISFLDKPHLTMVDCKQLSKVSFYAREWTGLGLINLAVPTLKAGLHITSAEFDLSFSCMQDYIGPMIGAYLGSTTVLTELVLRFPTEMRCQRPADEQCRLAILNGLERNATVNKLVLHTGIYSVSENRYLAHVILTSHSLYDVHLNLPDLPLKHFVKILSHGIRRNFSLVSLRFPPGQIKFSRQWFGVTHTVRRNQSLVLRAAQFVTGSDSGRDCAEAVEPVAWKPALIDKVCELASVDRREAFGKVFSSVRDLHGLDGFMRAAGVVRETVTCRSRGQVQLDQLDSSSWSCLRPYLRVADVLCDDGRKSAHQPE